MTSATLAFFFGAKKKKKKKKKKKATGGNKNIGAGSTQADVFFSSPAIFSFFCSSSSLLYSLTLNLFAAISRYALLLTWLTK